MATVKLSDSETGFMIEERTQDGETLGTFLERVRPNTNLGDVVIRVNGQAALRGQTLADNDRITLTPFKIEAG